MGKFFEKKITPFVYVQNDHRVMGIILRYVCWGTPPPPRGIRRLTAPSTDPQGWGQQRRGGGGGAPPHYKPQKGFTPLGVTPWLAATPVKKAGEAKRQKTKDSSV